MSDQAPTVPLELVLNEPNAKIVKGDCRRASEVVQQSSVALIITSPPYPQVPQPEPEYVTFENPMDFQGSHNMLREVWHVCFDLLEDFGRLAVNIPNIPTGAELGMAPNVTMTVKICLELGFVLREELIWDKGASYSPPVGSWPYPRGVLGANSHESILIFQKPVKFSQRRKDPSDYPENIREASKLTSAEHDWLTSSIWKISPEREGRALGHPFTFPEELPSRLIKLYTYVGDKVLDPFVGSGTTVLAASKLNRVGIGFELSDKYLEICQKRFAQGTLL